MQLGNEKIGFLGVIIVGFFHEGAGRCIIIILFFFFIKYFTKVFSYQVVLKRNMKGFKRELRYFLFQILL